MRRRKRKGVTQKKRRYSKKRSRVAHTRTPVLRATKLKEYSPYRRESLDDLQTVSRSVGRSLPSPRAYRPAFYTSPSLLRKTLVCVRRKERREVIHANGRAGSRVAKPVWNKNSKVRC